MNADNQCKKAVVIVLGMHRSGTSLVAGACQLAGAYLGKDIMTPQEDNPKGFWEDNRIVNIHDKVLKALGSNWDDPLPLPRKWWSTNAVASFKEELKELLKRDFAEAALPAIKDPRMCRLLLLWSEMFDELGWKPHCILVARNPIEVAASLQLRNGFNPGKSYFLWLRHMLEAERLSRSYARAVISYDQLLDQGSGLIEKVWEQLGLPWSGEKEQAMASIDEFIEPRLRHHEVAAGRLDGDPRLMALVGQAYKGYCALIENDRKRAGRIFADLERLVEGIDYMFTPLVTTARQEATLAIKSMEEQAAEYKEMSRRLSTLEGVAEARAVEINWVRQEITHLVMNQTQTLGKHRQVLAKAKRQIGELETEKARYEEQIAGRDRTIAALFSSTSWRITAPIRAMKRMAHWAIRLPIRVSRAAVRIVYRLGRWIYRRLPLSQYSRYRVKNFLFKRANWSDASTTTEDVYHKTQPADPISPDSNSVILVERAVQAAHQDKADFETNSDINSVTPTQILYEISERAIKNGDVKEYYTKRSYDLLHKFLSLNQVLTFPSPAEPTVSIILILYNRAELTYLCLTSILETVNTPIEVIIVDNSSTDDTRKLLSKIKGAKIIYNSENLGFLKGVNQALKIATGEYVLLLNNDAQLFPGALVAAIHAIESEQSIGAVGGRIVLLDGKLQEAGSIIWSDGSCLGYGRKAHPDNGEFLFRREVDYCSGAFLLINRDIIIQLGGFDEAFIPAYYEETDLCMCIRRLGYKILYEPNSVVLHYEFGSSDRQDDAIELQKRNYKKFFNKHKAVLETEHYKATPENILRARARSKNKGRILILDDQVPHRWLGSGFPRANDIVSTLVNLGYFVTFYPMTMPWEGITNLYEDIPPDVEVVYGCGTSELHNFFQVRSEYYNIVFISRPHNMEAFKRIYDKDPKLFSGTNVIYDAEALFAVREIEKQRLQNGSISEKRQNKLIAKEIMLAEPADRIVTVSESEATEFKKRGYKNVYVLGHQVEPHLGKAAFENRHGILFVGAIHDDDCPNADSVEWFVKHVWPSLERRLPKDISFVVAGTNKSKKIRALASSQIHVLGRVPDLRDLYNKCRLFVAPTRYSAGIPYKVHEAAAAGIPICATNLIARQLGWQGGKEIMVADSAEDFAAQCLKLYTDQQLWEDVRLAAFREVSRECSKEVFEGAVIDICDNCNRQLSKVRDGLCYGN